MPRAPRFTFLMTAVLALLLLAVARPITASEPWTFSLTPYLWLPNLNGDLRYDLPEDGGRLDVELGPNDYLSNLKFLMMLSGDARNGRYSVVSDVLYLDFSDEDSSVRALDLGNAEIPIAPEVNVGTRSSFRGTAWTLAGGYAVSGNPKSTLDLIGGFRYIGIRATSDWDISTTISAPDGSTVLARTGGIRKDADLWDGIVGLRGRVNLGDRWHLPYYLDAGAGASQMTWQAMAGVTYSYGWGDLGLSYRHLEVDEREDGLLQNVRLDGPAVSATFHF